MSTLTPAARRKLAAASPAQLEQLLWLLEPPPVTAIHSVADSAALFRPLVGGSAQELVAVAYLDRRHRVIGAEVLFRGGDCSSVVCSRSIFRRALTIGRYPAAAIILAHNHPSGDPEPSGDDISTTRSVKLAGSMLGIAVLDHVVIGDGGAYVSLAERGSC